MSRMDESSWGYTDVPWEGGLREDAWGATFLNRNRDAAVDADPGVSLREAMQAVGVALQRALAERPASGRR
jgi:hypothetical protein